MAMHLLGIDFVEQRRFGSPRGLLFLAVGMIAISLVCVDYLDARDELQRAEAEQTRLLQQTKSKTPAERSNRPGALQAEIKAAERIALQLNLPWNALLGTLEKNSNPDVALLTIESQGQTRRLHLTGEARSIDDIVAYAARLGKSPKITTATLSGHEEKQSGQVDVIRFALDVDWSHQ